jgi:hypothetical protein
MPVGRARMGRRADGREDRRDDRDDSGSRRSLQVAARTITWSGRSL